MRFATAFSLVTVMRAFASDAVNTASPLPPFATVKVSGAIVPLSALNPTV